MLYPHTNTSPQMRSTYLSLALCACGILTNILNISVFSRSSMKTPVNRIFLALAGIDLSFLTFWALHVSLQSFQPGYSQTCSESWRLQTTRLVLYHLNWELHISNVLTTTSLSVIRYVFVCRRQFSTKMFTYAQAKITIVSVVVGAVLLHIPVIVKLEVTRWGHSNHSSDSYYYCLLTSQLFRDHTGVFIVLESSAFFSVKIIPCLVLTYTSISLIHHLHKSAKRRVQVGIRTEHSTTNTELRSTVMILCVVLVSILTQTPNGILGVAVKAEQWFGGRAGGKDSTYWWDVYTSASPWFDGLTIVNTVINFPVYCMTSKQFRSSLRTVCCTSTSSCMAVVGTSWGRKQTSWWKMMVNSRSSAGSSTSTTRSSRTYSSTDV